MLFTAPAFLFVFLPLSMLFLVVFGKNRGRLCLGIVCAAFHIMLNIAHPINIVWLPLLALYSYLGALTSERYTYRWLNVLLGTLPLLSLILVRGLAYWDIGSYVYPVGMMLPTFCASAYIWDISLGERAQRNFARVWLYLSFFPIMLVGPFVRYSQFEELTDRENMSITPDRCAEGVKLFSVGFVKRIAVGAVLINGYDKIFAYSWDSPTLTVILFMLVLIYFGAFFSLSGYYDMAVGLSNMYGLRVEQIDANPFKIATPNEYSRALFGHVRLWADRYIIGPITRGLHMRPSRLLSISVYCVFLLLLVRSQISALVLCIPLIVVSLAFYSFRLDKKSGGARSGLRMLSGIAVILIFGFCWAFITLEEIPLDYIEGITFDNAEYQTDMVLVSFSALKYLYVSIVGILLIMPRTEWVMRLYRKAAPHTRAILDYVWLGVILLLLLTTILLFLPQFECYNFVPFEYIRV